MLPVAQSVYTSCEKTSSKQTESNTKCLRKTEFIHCCLLWNRLSVCLEAAVAANRSSSGEETGSQAGTARVWPLRGIATESTRSLSTRQRPEPRPAGCNTAVTSPAMRSRELPVPFCGQGSRARWSAYWSCTRHRTRAAPAPGWWEQEQCPGSVSSGSPPGALGRTDPHLPAAIPFHSLFHS